MEAKATEKEPNWNRKQENSEAGEKIYRFRIPGSTLPSSFLQITVGAPTCSNRLILTGDIEGLLMNMEDEAHRYNVGRRTAILAGVVLFYLAWDRLYRDFIEWRKRARRRAEY